MKRLLVVGLVAANVQAALAFSLFGPLNESFQQGGTPNNMAYGFSSDNGGPKNLGEEYRWNTSTLFYAFDANFLDYFGSNGVQAIVQAITILSNHLSYTNLSSYSPDLSEFPLEAQRSNFRAQALSLFDLKSVALHLMVEQLGLAEPDRYTWTLRERIPAPSCPAFVYYVIKRNFDPVTFEPSSYVNGTLYSYRIIELCPTPDRADAVEFLVDPLSTTHTAVASIGTLLLFSDLSHRDYGAVNYGAFYTGLTRDDMGGFRYLMRTNNMNVESVEPDSVLILTNTTTSQLLVTSNLTLLAAQALTNTAAGLQTIYPDLTVASTTNIFTNVVTTNVFAYFTNFPWSPPGSLATLVLVTNFTTNVQVQFKHTFANVVTNTFFTNSFVTIVQTNVTQAPWSPPGVLVTNVTTQTVLSNFVSGDFYIIPTNPCGFSIISTQLIRVLSETNTPIVATNGIGVTNVNGQQFTSSFVTYFTNFIFVVHPVQCLTNTVALRQGMDRVHFVRRDFDSLLGRFFHPITNRYTLVAVTNSQPVLQTFQRVVTRPDFLFSADDLLTTVASRSINFNSTNALPRLAGPGTIEPPVLYTFNKVGPLLINDGPFFIDEATASTNFIWGSFDGSTNAPIIYPSGTSIMNLENQVLIQISPAALPDGRVGVAYTNVFSGFTATGGQPPYTWSLAPGSPGLPPGLFLAANGVISGSPTVDGVYDFVVRLTDSGARFVDRPFTLRVDP